MVSISSLAGKVGENIFYFNDLAAHLDIPVQWLLQVSWVESNLKADALNSETNAYGYFQLMPSVVEDLGFREVDLTDLPQYFIVVKAYFDRYRPYFYKASSAADFYLFVFYPAAIIHGEYLLPTVVYQYNKGMDVNGEGQLTVATVKKWFDDHFGSVSLAPAIAGVSLFLLIAKFLA